MSSQEFSQEIIRLTKQWPNQNSVYQVLYCWIICALILSLICLNIDTVFVSAPHRKTAIPAVPGDPPALAEEATSQNGLVADVQYCLHTYWQDYGCVILDNLDWTAPSIDLKEQNIILKMDRSHGELAISIYSAIRRT